MVMPGSRMVSARAAALPGSTLTELYLLALSRGAIDLAVGTPGYPHTAGELVDEAGGAMRAGHNQYALPAGDPGLRRLIAETVCAGADPETEVTITAGATEAYYVALLATVDPGDEVILLDPGYEQFVTAVRLAGAVPVFVPAEAPEWRHDPATLAAAFGPRTRAIVLNSPNNPTGRVLSRAELDEIAGLCARWDVTVISDEVYRDFVYDGREHVSVADVPGFDGRSVVVGSLSKSYAVSGWRLGYLIADPARTTAMRRVHELTTNGTAAPLQWAAGRAVRGLDLAATSAGMAGRRDLAQEVFAAAGLKFAPVEGGCFLFADVSPIRGDRPDSTAFVRHLLETAGVLVVPGASFFSDPARGRDHVRIAFNRGADVLHEARRRIRLATAL